MLCHHKGLRQNTRILIFLYEHLCTLLHLVNSVIECVVTLPDLTAEVSKLDEN